MSCKDQRFLIERTKKLTDGLTKKSQGEFMRVDSCYQKIKESIAKLEKAGIIPQKFAKMTPDERT